YSPQDFNDRLLLGLKGTMSEAELHFIRARLVGGLRNKAARGELRLPLPVGLVRDEDDRIVLCPDEQVRHAIDRVFALWRALGSARQVALELIAEGQQLPARAIGQLRIADPLPGGAPASPKPQLAYGPLGIVAGGNLTRSSIPARLQHVRRSPFSPSRSLIPRC
ncbi:MAG: recombinase family protein, partial [Solirubrobacteraceae bacterium]